MPSIVSIATFASLASLALTTPVEKLKKRGAGTLHIDQVPAGTTLKVGALALQKAYQKYNKAVPTSIAAAAESGNVVATPEQYDSEYLCPVSVGGTTMNLDFDTGSADLWVFSDKLPSNERTGHAIYKTSTQKQLSRESWSISYGDGSGASGKVYADTVVIGQVTATSQAVEAATSISSAFISDKDNDGLVGLAFSSINTVQPNPAKTFFDNVMSSLDEALFAADLKKGQAGSYDFGYIDSSKYTGDIVYTPVDSSQGFWMFTADGYSVGTKSSFKSTSLTGIADTGTTLLLLDDSVVQDYWSNVKGSVNDNTQGGYTFPCSANLPDFSISVNGETRTVPGSYMNYAPVDSTTCFGGIQSDSGIGFSIFGDIFLKSQYVVFDASQGSPRIGFGQQA